MFAQEKETSRTSYEGSGLGLAIAQSFTELQGGEFKVETDADLFKVTITWKKQSQTKENTEN